MAILGQNTVEENIRVLSEILWWQSKVLQLVKCVFNGCIARGLTAIVDESTMVLWSFCILHWGCGTHKGNYKSILITLYHRGTPHVDIIMFSDSIQANTVPRMTRTPVDKNILHEFPSWAKKQCFSNCRQKSNFVPIVNENVCPYCEQKSKCYPIMSRNLVLLLSWDVCSCGVSNFKFGSIVIEKPAVCQK